jgi:hypothetical protein
MQKKKLRTMSTKESRRVFFCNKTFTSLLQLAYPATQKFIQSRRRQVQVNLAKTLLFEKSKKRVNGFCQAAEQKSQT